MYIAGKGDEAFRHTHEYEWTTTPPTEEGWYWAVHALEGEIVAVKFVGGGLVTWGGWNIDQTATSASVSDFTHWLGPLPVPEPPTE